MSDNRKRVESYRYDVSDKLQVSAFEYIDTFATRSYLADVYTTLDAEEKKSLQECDKILLSRAKEFYDYMNPIYKWANSDKPYSHWWWHLHKVVSGELKVNLDEEKIEY